MAAISAASGAYALAVVRSAVAVGMLGRPLATGGRKKDRMSDKKGKKGKKRKEDR